MSASHRGAGQGWALPALGAPPCSTCSAAARPCCRQAGRGLRELRRRRGALLQARLWLFSGCKDKPAVCLRPALVRELRQPHPVRRLQLRLRSGQEGRQVCGGALRSGRGRGRGGAATASNLACPQATALTQPATRPRAWPLQCRLEGCTECGPDADSCTACGSGGYRLADGGGSCEACADAGCSSCDAAVDRCEYCSESETEPKGPDPVTGACVKCLDAKW